MAIIIYCPGEVVDDLINIKIVETSPEIQRRFFY